MDASAPPAASSAPLFHRAAAQLPTEDELAALSERLGFGLDRAALAAMRETMGGLLSSLDALHALPETLPAAVTPTVPRLPGYRPPPEENPLNAWYWRTDIVDASAAAKGGPLANKRIALKDNVALAGVPMMNGSFVMEGFTPTWDATIVGRILAAGGRIVGKAACEDLCLSGSSFTTVLGPVLNPRDRTRVAGGSSGGSAALVANGDVDLAIACDQGGSIRLPSAFCGAVGLKPTFGLVPYTGISPIEVSIDHAGPVARTVRDCAVFLEVLAGADGLDPRQRIPPDFTPQFTSNLTGDIRGLRVGILAEGFNRPGLSDPSVDAAVRAAAQQLAHAGADVVDVSVPFHTHGPAVWNLIGLEGTQECMVRGASNATNMPPASSRGGYFAPTAQIEAYARGIAMRGRDLSPTVQLVALTGEYLRTAYGGRFYAKGQNLREVLRRAYDQALSNVDVLVLPTTPFPAPPLPTGAALPTPEYVTRALSMAANTMPFNLTGHPALSIDCAPKNAPLPIGLMIVGRHWEDATVLRVAAAHEKLHAVAVRE